MSLPVHPTLIHPAAQTGKERGSQNSLVDQCPFTAKSQVSILGQGTKTPQDTRCSQKIKGHTEHRLPFPEGGPDSPVSRQAQPIVWTPVHTGLGPHLSPPHPSLHIITVSSAQGHTHSPHVLSHSSSQPWFFLKQGQTLPRVPEERKIWVSVVSDWKRLN